MVESWFTKERMRFIDICLAKQGWIRRSCLMKQFHMSEAQATRDLRLYKQKNQGAITYNYNEKRYERAE
jgi:hypothetical protein